MLQELSIRNFAIISSLEVSFNEGMTVLTGETGAGKSIIIDAMGLLVGSRGSTDYIRQGENKCVLEGLFQLSPHQEKLRTCLTDKGIDFEEDMLIIHREIARNGKNVCRVNHQLVNTTTLREIGELLVDIHGQNEHQELMQANKHLFLLDEYGKNAIDLLKATYHETYHRYITLRKKVQQRQQNEKEFAQRVDMLKFQSEEIEAANLTIGEEESLLEERNKLVNFQKVTEALKNSYEALQGEETNSLDQIGFAMNAIEEIETLDPEYLELSETIKNSYFVLQEAANDLAHHLDALEMDEERLDEVENRLDIIRQLKRKYGDSVAAILHYYEEIAGELVESFSLENQNGQLEELLQSTEEELAAAAKKLSAERKKVARHLETEIVVQLKELYMEKALFEVRFETEAYGENGCDKAEFYLSTNPGEALKPLVKVASGGELSRIMLAIKTIFSRTQGITSIVFDEVDTGVSGRVAQGIANKIHQVSQNSQVLCITHLPQVAAVADSHYFIEKTLIAGRTETALRGLTDSERVNEIARMLAGDEITSLAIEHAKELVALAKK